MPYTGIMRQRAEQGAEMRAKGMSDEEICKALGCSRVRLSAAIARYRRDALKPRGVKVDKERIREIRDLIKAGKTQREIAELLDVKQCTVSATIRRHLPGIYSEQELTRSVVSQKKSLLSVRNTERYMGDEEIRIRYKQMSDRVDRIGILAQLNGMKKSEIKQIVMEERQWLNILTEKRF